MQVRTTATLAYHQGDVTLALAHYWNPWLKELTELTTQITELTTQMEVINTLEQHRTNTMFFTIHQVH
jgi:hypothetical protein